MRLLLGLILLLQSPVFACWRLEGSFAAGGRELKVEQKVEQNRVYSFALGDFFFHTKVTTYKTDVPGLELWVEEKKDRKLVELTREKILIKFNREFSKRLHEEMGSPFWHLTLKDI